MAAINMLHYKRLNHSDVKSTSKGDQVDICSFDGDSTWFLGVPRLFSVLQTEFLQNMITTFIPRWVEFRGPGANFPD